MFSLETERLLLRQWQTQDLVPFAEMNQDSDVMRYFPATLSQAQSDALADKIQTNIAKNGWGFWAVEVKESHDFIGFVGLNHLQLPIPQAPFIEVGWRLAKAYWNQGYATEGAHKAIEFAFQQLQQPCVYAITAKQNAISQHVMHKLGMVNSRNDFDHPNVEHGHILQRHCLYKLCR